MSMPPPLLVYRAAWTKEFQQARRARHARGRDGQDVSRPKPRSSVIDRAVQLHGGRGVTKGEKVEELYREIRALRIYEGATEVQKVVIAREALKNRPAKPAHGEERRSRSDADAP